jgi:hypothetical protein
LVTGKVKNMFTEIIDYFRKIADDSFEFLPVCFKFETKWRRFFHVIFFIPWTIGAVFIILFAITLFDFAWIILTPLAYIFEEE